MGSNPGQGTKIPYAVWCGQINGLKILKSKWSESVMRSATFKYFLGRSIKRTIMQIWQNVKR